MLEILALLILVMALAQEQMHVTMLDIAAML